MNKYKAKQKERSMNQLEPSNVVQLRPNLDASSIRNAEEAINLARQVRTELAEDIADLSMEQLTGMLTSYGIFVDSGKVNVKDMIMIENAIAAALYRYYGLEHPLHEVTEEVFSFEKED